MDPMNTVNNNNKSTAGRADADPGFGGAVGSTFGGGAAATGRGVPSDGGGFAGVGHGSAGGFAGNPVFGGSTFPTSTTSAFSTPGVAHSTMAGISTAGDDGMTRNTGSAMNQQMGQGVFGMPPTLQTQVLFNANRTVNRTPNLGMPIDVCFPDIHSRLLAGNQFGREVLQLCTDDEYWLRHVQVLKTGGIAAKELCSHITALRRGLVQDVQVMKNSVAEMDNFIESQKRAKQQAEALLAEMERELADRAS